MFSELLTEFRGLEFHVFDLTPAGDHVLVTVRQSGVGRTSGAARRQPSLRLVDAA